MKRRKGAKEFAHIGSVINKMLSNCRVEFDEDLARIWTLWDQAVGRVVAQNARPEAFKGKLLLVHVNSSTWAHQLQFLKPEIIQKINTVLGKPLIEDIKFKIGPV